MSVNSITNWGFNFFVSFTFLTLVDTIAGSGAVLVQGGLGVVAVVSLAIKLPETKSRSLNEITADVASDQTTG